MNEKNISPIKNIAQNELVSKNKRLFLKAFKPSNDNQISSQFRVSNQKYFDKNDSQLEEEKKLKQKNINIINNAKSNNIFRLTSASKNGLSLSQDKLFKKKKEHEENLKKLKELEKILNELEKEDISLINNINNLNKEEDKLKKDLKSREEEEKELNDELNNLKNINEEKNREYLHLMQNNNRGNNNINNNIQRNINNNLINNNNIERNINEEEPHSVNDLLNRVLRIQREVIGENNEEGQNNNNMNNINNNNDLSMESFYLDPFEDMGPPMTFEQIDALPEEKYPRKDTYEEKCVLCGFAFCYNDSTIRLTQCQHIFHKECLASFLENRQASKCPICKVSLIN